MLYKKRNERSFLLGDLLDKSKCPLDSLRFRFDDHFYSHLVFFLTKVFHLMGVRQYQLHIVSQGRSPYPKRSISQG